MACYELDWAMDNLRLGIYTYFTELLKTFGYWKPYIWLIELSLTYWQILIQFKQRTDNQVLDN